MSDIQRIEPPTNATTRELIMVGIKAALNAAPLVGGSIAEIVGYVGQRKSEERQTAFAEQVVQGLENLQIDVANLKDSFWSTMFHAIEVARRTHQEEKREALKSIVLNSAKPTAPSDDLQHIFVNMVADLTRSISVCLGFCFIQRSSAWVLKTSAGFMH